MSTSKDNWDRETELNKSLRQDDGLGGFKAAIWGVIFSLPLIGLIIIIGCWLSGKL